MNVVELAKMAMRKRKTVLRVHDGIVETLRGFDDLKIGDMIRIGLTEEDARRRPLSKVATRPFYNFKEGWMTMECDILEETELPHL
jgi:hypothetical protein